MAPLDVKAWHNFQTIWRIFKKVGIYPKQLEIGNGRLDKWKLFQKICNKVPIERYLNRLISSKFYSILFCELQLLESFQYNMSGINMKYKTVNFQVFFCFFECWSHISEKIGVFARILAAAFCWIPPLKRRKRFPNTRKPDQDKKNANVLKLVSNRQSKQCKTLRGPLSTIYHPRCLKNWHLNTHTQPCEGGGRSPPE